MTVSILYKDAQDLNNSVTLHVPGDNKGFYINEIVDVGGVYIDNFWIPLHRIIRINFND